MPQFVLADALLAAASAAAAEIVDIQCSGGARFQHSTSVALGKEVMFPVKHSASASARDTLDARIAWDYC